MGEPVKELDKILSVGEKYGDVIAADSIAQLAKGIGCDEATFFTMLGTCLMWIMGSTSNA